MNAEKEITELLLAAGCGEAEIEMIVFSIRKGDRKKHRKADREMPEETAGPAA